MKTKITQNRSPIANAIIAITQNRSPIAAAIITLLAVILLSPAANLQARSYVATVYEWNPILLKYMTQLRIMTLNFPCDPHPECLQSQKQPAGKRYEAFQEIEQEYQSGYLAYLEGEYRSTYDAYGRVIIGMDALFTDLASFYLDRSRELLVRSLGKTDPDEDDPYDLSYAEIKSYYTPNSSKAKDIRREREVPTEDRKYNNQETVYYQKRRELALNFKQGFARLRRAREAYKKSITNEISTMRRLFRQSPDFEELERLNNTDNAGTAGGQDAQGVSTTQETEDQAGQRELARQEYSQDKALAQRMAREKREIEKYQNIINIFSAKYPRNSLILESKLQKMHWLMKSIAYSRMSKINLWRHYHIKHPNGNYVQFNPFGKNRKGETPSIEEVTMNWHKNPYLVPKDKNPMFDFTIPADTRRDIMDVKSEVYNDRLDVEIRLKYQSKKGNEAESNSNSTQ